MDGEFRRPGEEFGGIEVDATVETLARQYRWAARGLMVADLVILVGVPTLVFRAAGFVPAVAVLAVVFALGGLPLVRVRGTDELVTDRPPSAVRAEFRRVENPGTALWMGWADGVEPVEVPGAVAAADVRVTSLGVFSATVRVVVTEGEDGRPGEVPGGERHDGTGNPPDDRDDDGLPTTDDRPASDPGPIRLWLTKDGDPFSTAEVRIHDEGDRTRVTVEGRRRSRFHGLRLAVNYVEGHYQERVLEHYGYEVLDSTLHFGLQSDGRSQ